MKELTLDNICQPDPAVLSPKYINSEGERLSLNLEVLYNQIFSKKLNNNVPEEITNQIKAIQGTMIYGYFFYPIFTIAAEQSAIILETAITYKCIIHSMPDKIEKLKNKIAWLHLKSFITDNDFKKIDCIRKLRNTISHPKKQNIITPYMAIDLINNVIDIVNELFINKY